MTQEEILYKKSKTGTTVFYFAAGVDNTIVPFLQEPAYVQLNGLGGPSSFHIYSSGITELWTLQSSNNYLTNVILTAVTNNYVTGYSFSETFNKTLTIQEQQLARDRFYNNVVSTVTGQTIALPPSFQTFVFFDEHEVDDMFANIKLSRTFNTLDTLSIYNKPVNSIPQQEAKTGVLFGKLQAIQVLKDEVGNNIKIPLRNVPIGIFNPTEEFPAPMSLDDNGDRFFMNIQESSTIGEYFNIESYTSDTKFLKSQSQFLTVPEKFKYITTTNENGEFVIYNAPIGNQTLVLEVDLFKQGLTKDEIILNNFPFPTNDDSNIGEFPCYNYQQLPVDIVPAWGNGQSGYTEINININLDLRKWATYIFPPASFGNEKLETTVAKNVANTFKIQVRDMTNKFFEPKPLEIVQIPNDLDRADGSKYLWYNELLSQRRQVEFIKHGCHVIKLPANLYDPNGYKTDINGIPSTSKGLWLAAYQFNSFVNVDRCKRTTGGIRIGDADTTLNHFDLNNYAGAAPTASVGSGIGKFPYEKPWSLNYPEPYRVTKKPVSQRFYIGTNRLIQSPYVLEEPPYSDGDLVGNIYDVNDNLSNVGGFGLQEFNGVHFPNQIAFVATKDYMYKYESGVSDYEQYSNGYEQFWTPNNPGPYIGQTNILNLSNIIGEKYQRVECGYGYFMKYQDWTRVYRLPNGSDTTATWDYNSVGVAGAGNYGQYNSLINYRHNMHNIDDQSMAFAFDTFLNNKINTGGIYIYRIVESGLNDIKIPDNFIIPTFWELHFGLVNSYDYNNGDNFLYRLMIENKGVIPVKITNTLSGIMRHGTTGVLYNPGDKITLQPGEALIIDENNGNPQTAVVWKALYLPGNNNYNSTTNKYTSGTYLIRPAIRNIVVDMHNSSPIRAISNFTYFNSSNDTFHYFDNDIDRPAYSSGYHREQFISQSDVSSVGEQFGIKAVGWQNNDGDLIDMYLKTF